MARPHRPATMWDFPLVDTWCEETVDIPACGSMDLRRKQVPTLCIVRALVAHPELGLLLEVMTRHRNMALQKILSGQRWYSDPFIVIHGARLIIRELAACDPNQVKLVVTHFPEIRVEACTSNPRSPCAILRLVAVASCVPRLRLVHTSSSGGMLGSVTYLTDPENPYHLTPLPDV